METNHVYRKTETHSVDTLIRGNAFNYRTRMYWMSTVHSCIGIDMYIYSMYYCTYTPSMVYI
jgi:hypothetical protein